MLASAAALALPGAAPPLAAWRALRLGCTAPVAERSPLRPPLIHELPATLSALAWRRRRRRRASCRHQPLSQSQGAAAGAAAEPLGPPPPSPLSPFAASAASAAARFPAAAPSHGLSTPPSHRRPRLLLVRRPPLAFPSRRPGALGALARAALALLVHLQLLHVVHRELDEQQPLVGEASGLSLSPPARRGREHATRSARSRSRASGGLPSGRAAARRG